MSNDSLKSKAAELLGEKNFSWGGRPCNYCSPPWKEIVNAAVDAAIERQGIYSYENLYATIVDLCDLESIPRPYTKAANFATHLRDHDPERHNQLHLPRRPPIKKDGQ